MLVLTGDVVEPKTEQAKALFSKPSIAFQLCDVTDWDQQKTLFELAVKKFGKINVRSMSQSVPPCNDSSFNRSNVCASLCMPMLA